MVARRPSRRRCQLGARRRRRARSGASRRSPRRCSDRHPSDGGARAPERRLGRSAVRGLLRDPTAAVASLARRQHSPPRNAGRPRGRLTEPANDSSAATDVCRGEGGNGKRSATRVMLQFAQSGKRPRGSARPGAGGGTRARRNAARTWRSGPAPRQTQVWGVWVRGGRRGGARLGPTAESLDWRDFELGRRDVWPNRPERQHRSSTDPPSSLSLSLSATSSWLHAARGYTAAVPRKLEAALTAMISWWQRAAPALQPSATLTRVMRVVGAGGARGVGGHLHGSCELTFNRSMACTHMERANPCRAAIATAAAAGGRGYSTTRFMPAHPEIEVIGRDDMRLARGNRIALKGRLGSDMKVGAGVGRPCHVMLYSARPSRAMSGLTTSHGQLQPQLKPHSSAGCRQREARCSQLSRCLHGLCLYPLQVVSTVHGNIGQLNVAVTPKWKEPDYVEWCSMRAISHHRDTCT
eukprot:351375-Chlamydomonas_euryale.AAC.10